MKLRPKASAGIRSRAPLRLGLAGGGTDLSPFCDEYGGAVLNCTIDRYAYAFISPRTDGKVAFHARDVGRQEFHKAGAPFDTAEGLRLHRCVYNHFLEIGGRCFESGLTLTTVVDAPPGSGLGSSSGLVVAICEAFCGYIEEPLGRYEVAHLAYEIERLRLGLAGGKQDQYAAAFGGVNFIEFLAGDRVIVNPLRIDAAILSELETSLVVCFTGTSRESEHIIRQQTSHMQTHNATTLAALFEMKASAIGMKQALLAGDMPAMARMLNESWASKKRTAAAISSGAIETLIEIGLNSGAVASKISGAGGGGFIMFMVAPENRSLLIKGLNEAGAATTPVHLTSKGAESWRAPHMERKTRAAKVFS